MSTRRLLVTLALALFACGPPVDPACPLRCGDRCLAVNVCDAISCPVDAPCDPCSAQCRASCSADNTCKSPTEICCAAGCADLTSDRWHCGACDHACGVDADACRNGACVCGDMTPCGAGMLCCGGACALIDADNCGACGLRCGEGTVCNDGQCETLPHDPSTSGGPLPPPDMAHAADKPGKDDMAVGGDMVIPSTCVPLTCAALPPSATGVSRCDAAIYNRRTQTPLDDRCGGLLSCGDCCHTSSACLVGHCVRTECACATSGTLGLCSGDWLGGNCCQFTLAKTCSTAADCP